ncbi:hypothetical protein R5A27_000932 [Salmonella enterica]|nr:hypothetical protein [Salmonella enterica]
MTRSDIARYKEREREILTVEGVTRALIEKGIEPQMTLKAFAQRLPVSVEQPGLRRRSSK